MNVRRNPRHTGVQSRPFSAEFVQMYCSMHCDSLFVNDCMLSSNIHARARSRSAPADEDANGEYQALMNSVRA